MSNGAQLWNSNSTANGSGVTFQNSNATNFVWEISAAWPKATFTYKDSAGNSHTYPIDDSANSTAVAVTTYLPDFNSAGQMTGTAGAAVTLINTNGTYSVNGTNFPMWDPNGANFGNALQGIGTHESGHGLGLGDQTSANCGDVMSPWNATTSDPSGATNDQSGCMSTTITTCDDGEIKSNPNGLYTTPGGGGGGDPCLIDPNLGGCGCGSEGCSPIIIDTTGTGFDLTSAAGGVVFDISGTGHAIQIAWTAPGAQNAFLCLPDTNGRCDNGKELFGNFTPQPVSARPNGFAALAVYDQPSNGGNDDGVIDSHDAIFSSLRLWIDFNHDAISQPNELYTLPSLGVTSISLNYKWDRRTDQYGNVFRYRAQVESTSGVGRTAYDVFLVTQP